MYNEQQFYKLARAIQKERLMNERCEKLDITNQANGVYSLFHFWCCAFKNGQCSLDNFKEYLKKENVKIDFWVKKRISELYFNCSYEFDYKTMSWKRIKTKGDKVVNEK